MNLIVDTRSGSTHGQTVSAATHTVSVERLLASYRGIPVGDAVRLAKRTSNLFRPRTRVTGLDVSGLDGVISIDAEARTADVQGMCTYEDLVEVTLAHGLIPLVVPQLRTITVGGAVTGLGIEATSFRNGLPHESVIEMDVMTGAGDVVTARMDNEHVDLFRAFPNSYGSLGYAIRLRIELEPVPELVQLRHVRFDDAVQVANAIASIADSKAWEGQRVDGLDGVAFEPGEHYLTLATWCDPEAGTSGRLVDAASLVSDYTGERIFYRSLQERTTDMLRMQDYLWRWDTDWFWCSGAFGLHNPRIRRVWPRRWRRSDVYHKLIGLDRRFSIVDRLDRRAGRPARERVIQDVEIPVGRLPDFLNWFDEHVGMRPVWLCPLRLRDDRTWPSYPLHAGEVYVNVGFWGTVPVGKEATNAPLNRAIEKAVHDLGGHKSLYSEAFYDRATFDSLYNGPGLEAVKRRYDRDNRLTTLYDKAVRRQ